MLTLCRDMGEDANITLAEKSGRRSICDKGPLVWADSYSCCRVERFGVSV